MLRWMTPFLVAIFAIGTAAAAEPRRHQARRRPRSSQACRQPCRRQARRQPGNCQARDSPAVKSANSPAAAKRADNPAAARRAAVRAASQLPPGLPRAHYKYRTTVAPPPRRSTCAAAARWWSRKRSRCAVHAGRASVPYAPRVFGTPLLPGSSTLPGYYGTSHSYSYDGPYYGGPYGPYWNRLPYACGVYGYC